MSKKLIGQASLLLVGALFGLSGVIGKYLSTWLNPYQVVEYRFIGALFFAIVILIVSKQKFTFKKLDLKTLFLFAITFPISVIFFYLAIFNTSVSLAVFSFYIATVVSSFIIGKIHFGEKICTNKKISLFFIFLAVLVFTNPFNNFSIQIGFIYGVISGIFQTIASMYQKIVGASTNRLSLLIVQAIAGVGVSALSLVALKQPILPIIPMYPLLIIILFGAIFLFISYLFLVGFKHTNLNTGSILVSTELFFGPFFALMFLSEKMSTLELIGGALIAVAVVWANRDSSKA